MKRRLEPELMDGEEQALAYAEADFSEANTLFIDLLRTTWGNALQGAQAIDLGCGPADIPRRLLTAYPTARCDAVDGSAAMLRHARAALAAWPSVAARCRLIEERIPTHSLTPASYDLILSNSLLHHLHEPQVLWQEIRRLARPRARVLVMDLMRPPSAGWVESLVATYAADAPEILKRDFRNSLYAAFEPAEVVAQLRTAGLHTLEVAVVSDRHLAVSGVLDDL